MKIRLTMAALIFSLIIFQAAGQDFSQQEGSSSVDDWTYNQDILENLGFNTDYDGSEKYEDFQLEDIDGGMTRLSDYEGDVILLNFWATWCGPCRSEMPSMEELYDEFNLDDFEIVAVNIGDDLETVLDFIEENDYTFPVLLDQSGEIGGLYGADAIPLTYIIDRQGYIIASINSSIVWDTDEIISVMDYLASDDYESPEMELVEKSSRIDSAINWQDGTIYFMSDYLFSQFNWSQNSAVPESPEVRDNESWPGISFSRIDAIFDHGNGKLHFFSGDQYIRFDKAGISADPGYPKPIKQNWPGVTFDSIDAAVNNGQGKAYFFKDNQYIRYDLASDQADPGYPQAINNITWPGLTFESIDAVINWENSKFYFFSGDQFVSFDIVNDVADPGYPKFIADYWPGLEF